MLAKIVDTLFIKKPRFRRAITRLVYGSRDVSVNVVGTDLRINSLLENGYLRAARFSGRSSLLRDEAPVLVTLASLVAPGMTFVDVGANIGVFSSVLSKFKHIHDNFQVVAFEVHPSTYSRLQSNAELHGFQAINCGIGGTADKLKFVGGAVSHVTTLADMANRYSINNETFEAEIRPLSSFQLEGQLLIKIDVEGQELAVLEGARSLFDAKRVRGVYLDGYGQKACWDFLSNLGFLLLDARTLLPANRETFSLLALARPHQG